MGEKVPHTYLYVFLLSERVGSCLWSCIPHRPSDPITRHYTGRLIQSHDETTKHPTAACTRYLLDSYPVPTASLSLSLSLISSELSPTATPVRPTPARSSLVAAPPKCSRDARDHWPWWRRQWRPWRVPASSSDSKPGKVDAAGEATPAAGKTPLGGGGVGRRKTMEEEDKVETRK